jgi:gamma-glutamyl-gamma-aminobutyrate hydrolase PuuD
VHGILVPGGFGERGAEGKIRAAGFARTRAVPYFGICFGMQMACIEAARNLAGICEAGSTEFGPTPEPLIGLMTEWMRGNELEMRKSGGDLGGTMRVGAYEAVLEPDSHVARIYGATTISERHRHRYEVNMRYRERLEAAGLRISGLSPDGLLPEIIEIPDHPWFIGVQYHPELKSKPFDPHPLFASFIAAPSSRAGWCHPDIESAGFFVCQQHAPQYFWRPEYQRHENTAQTVQEVCLVADRPLQLAGFLQAFAGSDDIVASDSRLEIATGRGKLMVLTGDGFGERYGTAPPASHRLPALAGYSVGVSSLNTVKAITERASVATADGDGRLTIVPEDAFGTALAFARV